MFVHSFVDGILLNFKQVGMTLIAFVQVIFGSVLNLLLHPFFCLKHLQIFANCSCPITLASERIIIGQRSRLYHTWGICISKNKVKTVIWLWEIIDYNIILPLTDMNKSIYIFVAWLLLLLLSLAQLLTWSVAHLFTCSLAHLLTCSLIGCWVTEGYPIHAICAYYITHPFCVCVCVCVCSQGWLLGHRGVVGYPLCAYYITHPFCVCAGCSSMSY